MKASNRPTMADVASQARVSTATASRVIHGTGPVSDDVRKRIEQAAAALGYVPRQSGREPADGTIAVLTGDLLNPFFPEIIRGIQDEVDNYGLTLTLYNLTDHAHRQRQVLEKLSRQRLDGVIIMGTVPFPEMLTWRQRRNVPMVVLNRHLAQPGVHCIVVDLESALYRATQHLIGLNHNRIGYLASSVASETTVARRRGLDAALAEAGLEMHPEWSLVVPPGVEIDGGYQAMRNLLSSPVGQRPTAVIAFNDVVAIGALHAVRVLGLAVPQDVSVLGVDDIFVASHSYPPLTTIGQPKYRMGKLAVQTLCHMAEDPLALAGGCTVLESPLIVRESTGPAPVQ